jgi:hypothetical protein
MSASPASLADIGEFWMLTNRKPGAGSPGAKRSKLSLLRMDGRTLAAAIGGTYRGDDDG